MFSQTNLLPTRPDRTRLPWLLAIALAALTLALGAHTAAAADPVLTTPENPVVIPHGQTTKPITVSWNLNGAVAKATLKVTDNANVQVYSEGVATPTGTSQSFPVAYGKTYTARLYDIVTPTKTWGAPLVITTTRPKPTLTVTPNPVCFSQPQGTQPATLIYALNGQPAAHLLVTDDTAMTKVVDMAVTGSGSKVLTVTYGHKYTGHLLLPPANAMDLAPPVTITTEVCKGPPPPCTQDCPTLKWAFDRHGTYARFQVIPSKPASLKIEASTSAPVNGQFANVVATVSRNTFQATMWNPDLLGLEAATHYYCLISATDQANNVVTEPCEFTTLKRVVNVKFNSLTIYDDSDDGAGELRFKLSINGNPVHQFAGSYTAVHTVTFNSGFAVVPSGPTLTLSVFGWDDDDDGFWDSCAGWDVFSHPWQGSDSCADWSTVEQKFTFPTGPAEVWSLNQNMKTFNGSTVTSPLQFEVKVSVSVDYKQ